jgi:hypothetical protein
MKEYESGYNKGTHTHMFIAALFTRPMLWKQAKCATTDEWIMKMCCLYIIKFYSTSNKNEILSFAGKLTKLENIILSEVGQVHKARS